jgi:hypothetical protein
MSVQILTTSVYNFDSPRPLCGAQLDLRGLATSHRGAFRCASCSLRLCLHCGVSHPAMTCAQFEVLPTAEQSWEGTAFFHCARRNQYKRCKRFRRFVERIDGCDHMRCLCGWEFCYRCGAHTAGCTCSRTAAQQTVRLTDAEIDTVTTIDLPAAPVATLLYLRDALVMPSGGSGRSGQRGRRNTKCRVHDFRRYPYNRKWYKRLLCCRCCAQRSKSYFSRCERCNYPICFDCRFVLPPGMIRSDFQFA